MRKLHQLQLIATISTTLLCTSPTRAIGPGIEWIICDDNLELVETLVIDANEQRLLTTDKFGIRTPINLDTIFFAYQSDTLRPLPIEPESEPTDSTAEEPSSPSYHSIQLTDGQIINAQIIDSSNPDFLRYHLIIDNKDLATGSLPLDRILHITTQKTDANPTPTLDQPFSLSTDLSADTIITLNNDIITGFIEHIGSQCTIALDTRQLTLPLQQIQSIHLANIIEPAPGIMLLTNAGSRLFANTLDSDFQHQTTLTLASGSLGLQDEPTDSWRLPNNLIAGIEVHQPNTHILGLAQLAPTKIEPTGGRAWTPTPTTSQHATQNPVLATIDLQAPVKMVYSLPTGTTRFACTIEAPINQWTDCIATFTTINAKGHRVELLSARLNDLHPSHEINTPIEPNSKGLEIRIDPGEHGPIQDRVLIHAPRLLIES